MAPALLGYLTKVDQATKTLLPAPPYTTQIQIGPHAAASAIEKAFTVQPDAT